MNTCSTCKWWKPDQLSFDVETIQDGKIVMVKSEPSHFGDCLCPALELYFNNNVAGREFKRRDGMLKSGNGPQSTGPDFGCVHHEAKPDKE